MVIDQADRPLSLAELSALTSAGITAALARDAGQTARWLHQAACEGLVEAQTALGQMLLDGRGTPAHAGAARRWFARAAEAGHPPAANMLGRCLERGWGGVVDMPRAAHWYRVAAEAGLDWGQYNLANMVLRGRGVPRDVPQSLRWFTVAAEAGHAKSMNLVGRFFEEGWAGQIDLHTAAEWYRRAAEGGDFRGQYNWALVLAQSGRQDEADSWFAASGQQGSLDFCRVAAESLLARTEPTLQRIGLRIAARCCHEGGPEDYQRYAFALLRDPASPPRLTQVWLSKAAAAGSMPALDALPRIEAACKAAERRGLRRWLTAYVRPKRRGLTH